MKILNLYAGIGGNRKLWGDEHEITAVENVPEIAKIYQDFFPKDRVLVEDAHQYLLDHYLEYDFIWSSPPCQTHSSFRYNICVRYHGTKPIYPDMTLWQEILFLKHHARCDWVVENVKPYYSPLIDPSYILQRHYFWGNKQVQTVEFETDLIRKSQIPDLQLRTGFNLSPYKLKNKRQILRNCVSPELGLYVFLETLKINRYVARLDPLGESFSVNTIDFAGNPGKTVCLHKIEGRWPKDRMQGRICVKCGAFMYRPYIPTTHLETLPPFRKNPRKTSKGRSKEIEK